MMSSAQLGRLASGLPAQSVGDHDFAGPGPVAGPHDLTGPALLRAGRPAQDDVGGPHPARSPVRSECDEAQPAVTPARPITASTADALFAAGSVVVEIKRGDRTVRR